MRKVSTFEAKSKLSALIKAATAGEPQIITNNGVEKAVVISFEEYKRLTAKGESLGEFLLNSPLRNSDIDLSRSKDNGRTTLDFSDESK